MQKLIEIFPLIETDPDLAAKYAVALMLATGTVFFMIWNAAVEKKEKKRIEALRSHAEERGLMFDEKTEIPEEPAKGVFFIQGHSYSRKASNITHSVKAGRHTFNVFDYEYVTGAGKSAQLHQYACALCGLHGTTGRFYPVFCMEPENFMHKAEDVFTHADIDFDLYPRFSKQYHLTGPSREKIEAFFTPGILSCLESHPGLEIYSDGFYITICRKGHLSPKEIADFETEAGEIIQALAI